MTIWKLIFGYCGSNEPDREYMFSSKENALTFCKKVTARQKWELVSEDEDEGEVFIHFKQRDSHYPHVSALNRTLFCEIMPVELDPINY